MNLRQLRLARGWSQEQLAELAGLNIRTIQRVERGQNAGLETLKALAAVFETSVHQLQEPPLMSVNVQAMPDVRLGVLTECSPCLPCCLFLLARNS